MFEKEKASKSGLMEPGILAYGKITSLITKELLFVETISPIKVTGKMGKHKIMVFILQKV